MRRTTLKVGVLATLLTLAPVASAFAGGGAWGG